VESTLLLGATVQGRTQGEGVGVKTPLQLDILRKVHYLRKGD